MASVRSLTQALIESKNFLIVLTSLQGFKSTKPTSRFTKMNPNNSELIDSIQNLYAEPTIIEYDDIIEA